ncbi:MAG: cell wall hydrolase [Tistlia sp.]|uniref:cell wall hydrolase n=1 Tax=Tistlia sp. TaxID=3057121 RepID=UPI0034A0E6DA
MRALGRRSLGRRSLGGRSLGRRALGRSGLAGLLLGLALLAVPAGGAAAQEVEAAEFECLALNVYFEAGGESRLGRLAVAWVTLNRWADARFPDSLCGVVRQGGEARWRCQFHWWCDGKPDVPTNPARWADAEQAARDALSGRRPDPTGGALFFHNGQARPKWRHHKTATAVIGNHTFYR